MNVKKIASALAAAALMSATIAVPAMADEAVTASSSDNAAGIVSKTAEKVAEKIGETASEMVETAKSTVSEATVDAALAPKSKDAIKAEVKQIVKEKMADKSQPIVKRMVDSVKEVLKLVEKYGGDAMQPIASE